MQHGQTDGTLSALLSILNERQLGSPIASVVNKTSIDLIARLLSGEDYTPSLVADRLVIHTSDAQNLMDALLYVVHERCLSDDIDQRARRLMQKVVTDKAIVPPSLMLAGVTMTTEVDYMGTGGLADVHTGKFRGEVVALKVLRKPDAWVAFYREALMWRSLNHDRILPFIGIYELSPGRGTVQQLALVSPYMKKGNLSQWRKTNPSIPDIEERILEVAHGVEYIHSKSVVHGDLSGDNVLLDDNLHVKIADFGLTRHSEATNTQTGSNKTRFAAPELFGYEDNSDEVPDRTYMSDVYAFGCLYYQIHYNTIPFAGKQGAQVVASVINGVTPPRLPNPPLSIEKWELIQSCWVKAPLNRPTMKEIVEMMSSFASSTIGSSIVS